MFNLKKHEYFILVYRKPLLVMAPNQSLCGVTTPPFLSSISSGDSHTARDQHTDTTLYNAQHYSNKTFIFLYYLFVFIHLHVNSIRDIQFSCGDIRRLMVMRNFRQCGLLPPPCLCPHQSEPTHSLT